MSAPSPAISIIQPEYVFNPGAPLPRDSALQYYHQSYFRQHSLRRVVVVDTSRRALLLTTPMRVMSAWHARLSNPDQNAPYLAIHGWQDPIPQNLADSFLRVLQSAIAGSIISVAGSATVNALHPPNFSTSTEDHPVPQIKPVIQDISHATASWLPMFADNLTGVEAATAFVADNLDLPTPASGTESPDTVLLLREEEADVAMASPMILLQDSRLCDGIQFRGGYGAIWDPAATHHPLKQPLYSPTHRIPAPNRVWAFGGPST